MFKMPRTWRLAAVSLAFLLCARALAETAPLVFLEVQNRGDRLFQRQVETRIPLKDLVAKGQGVGVSAAETDPKGRPLRDATAQLDVEGQEAVISLLLSGVTDPGQRRYFLVQFSHASMAATPTTGPHPHTDLRLDASNKQLAVSNEYFTALVAERGGGGFPHTIVFNGSGNRYEDFYWADRLYSKERGVRLLRDDANSTTRVVRQGPLRIVLEARARYGPPGNYAPGGAHALYRWTYGAYSPIVEVHVLASRTDDYRWSELQWMHLSRDDALFAHWLGGSPLLRGRFTDASQSRHLPRWAVMHNADDAVGLGHPDGITLFDGVTEYFNYIKCVTRPWTERKCESRALLYVGPALSDPTRYERLLTGAERLAVRRIPLAQEAKPPAVAPQYVLRNRAMSLEFAGEAARMGLVRIVNKLGDQVMVETREEKPLLWRIELRSWQKGLKPVVLDNRAAATCSAEVSPGKLILKWDGIAVPDEPKALSVAATVELPPESHVYSNLSKWRIAVDCRSKRYGVWDVFFPVLSRVGPDVRPDVAVPRSNWGMLYRRCEHRQAGSYPSCRWPMQFICVNRGKSALYLACHDPSAMPKSFSLAPLGEFHFRVHAPNQGVAGNGYHQPFPIVVGAYAGDWWGSAWFYRNWALDNAPWAKKGPLAARKDTPARLLALGLWMLGSGYPKDVVPRMKQAARRFSVPIGIHWYNWHQIPFDTYYPNYFPTKPGFPEAVRELVRLGMVVMPYINGRLWDSGNENFKTALPYTCKGPNRKPYIEIYGSKRPLAVMCPATTFWQDKVTEICRRLMTEVGVNAIYIDQIAAAGARLCYDETHGHPLGGGSYWVDGYRQMLSRIHRLAHAEGRDVIITSENNTECYLDNVDAFLVWNPRYDNEIPMLPAAYSGRTVYFSSPSNVGDTLAAFAMSQGRDWLWGCQPGWMGFELLSPENRKKAEYLNRLAAHRLAAREFMVLGRLAGEVRPLNHIPIVQVTWGRGWGNRGAHEATLPAVMATKWCARDGRSAAAMTNWDDQPHVFTLPPDVLPQPSGRPTVVLRIGPQGLVPVGYSERPRRDLALELAPREVIVLTTQEVASRRAALALVAERLKALGAAPSPFHFWDSLERRCAKLWRAVGSLPSDNRWAAPCFRRCIACILAAAKGVEPSLRREAVAAAGRPYEVVVSFRPGRARGRCGTGGRTVPFVLHRRQDTRVSLSATAPTLGEASARRLMRHVRVELSERDDGPAIELPFVLRVVRPMEVALAVEGSRRAGETLMVKATVRNNTREERAPALALLVPASWAVEPGRRVRLPGLRPGEVREIGFLCHVARDALTARARVAASVQEAAAAVHVVIEPPRPQAKALQRNPSPKIDGDLAEWRQLQPVALDKPHARIEGWKGPADCSARLWVGWDSEHLIVAAEVRDDVFDQPHRGFDIWRGDCIQMALRPGPPLSRGGYHRVVEFGLALTPAGPQVFQWKPLARELVGAKVAVRREDGATRYEAAVPWSALGRWRPTAGASLGWSFTVNDSDGQGFRGWLEWTPGICGTKDASAFGRLVFQ